MSSAGTSSDDVIQSKGFAVREINGQFQVWDFPRRPVGSKDVLIRILYCGICHGDIHAVKNEWKNSNYPMVPGHEIVGIVERVGDQVTRVKQGEHVGVGFMVNSCGQCHPCKEHLEQHCVKGCAGTFNSTEMDRKTTTYGGMSEILYRDCSVPIEVDFSVMATKNVCVFYRLGYSNSIVVVEDFVLKIPKNLSLDRVGPLLCAGITVYSALRQHNVGNGTRLGIVGLGGLGHLAVKYGVAMNADVTVISTSESKHDDAIKLGAKRFLLSTDLEQINAVANIFDIIIDCVPAKHDLNQVLSTLKFGGTFCMIGAPSTPLEISPFSLIQKRLNVTGSFIGGIEETQEMLDFSAQHKIACDVEVIEGSPSNLAMAFDRILKSDVKYRFVIDLGKTFHR